MDDLTKPQSISPGLLAPGVKKLSHKQGLPESFSLSAAQWRVVERILKRPDEASPQIAKGLGITINTIKTHLRDIYRELGVCSRPGMIMMLFRSGVVYVEGDGSLARRAPEEVPVAVFRVPAQAPRGRWPYGPTNVRPYANSEGKYAGMLLSYTNGVNMVDTVVGVGDWVMRSRNDGRMYKVDLTTLFDLKQQVIDGFTGKPIVIDSPTSPITEKVRHD